MVRKTVYEAFTFACAGGSVALLHLAFVYFLTSVLGFWYLFSTIVSYSCAIVLNFILQKFVVFRQSDMALFKSELIGYISVSVTMLGLNILLMFVFVDIFMYPYLIVQACVIFFLSIVAFCINRNVLFRPKAINQV